MARMFGVWALGSFTACDASLSYYGGRPPEDSDTEEPTAPEAPGDSGTAPTDPATGGDADTDTDSDADADADTDSDSDADSDSDTDADVDTADTGTPPAVILDGTYVGTIDIDYTLLVPLLGGNAVCSGPVTLTVDQASATPIVGTVQCDWPVLAIWAQALLDDVDGTLDGTFSGAIVSGSTQGQDGTGTFVWSEVWGGIVVGNTIAGGFTGGTVLWDNYDALFTATWVGP